MTLPKRLFDLMMLAVFSVLLIPVICILIAVMAAVQGRPIFFGSDRMRTIDQKFTLWKLRSMTQDDTDRGVSGGDKAGRITPIGRVLRRSRLDELPQLLNILRGDISFVGPRPPRPVYVARFPRLYGDVLRSRPGVTGLASLVFAAHEEALLTRCITPEETDAVYVRRCVPRKARIDLIYQNNQSLGLDAWLIALTAARALRIVRPGKRLPRRKRAGKQSKK